MNLAKVFFFFGKIFNTYAALAVESYKMKKAVRALLSFIHLTFLFFTFGTLVACTQFVSGYVYEKEDSANYMYISLESNSSIVSSRTITAPAIDFTDSTQNYVFYIWGKSNSGSLTPRQVDFDVEDGTSGTIELDFPVTSYNFTLAVTEGEAVNTSDGDHILTDAIFVGYANVDLTYTKTVKFYLSAINTSGYGAAYIDFYLDDSWSDSDITLLQDNYSVTVGLYTIADNTLLEDYSAVTIANLNRTTGVSWGNAYSGTPAGVYNLIVNMAKSDGTKTHSYSDRIIIAANRTIDTSVYIPNIIEKVPATPQNFKAAHAVDAKIYHKYNSTTGVSTRLDEEDDVNVDDYNVDGYGLLFTWDDCSNNEDHFKITLANLNKIVAGNVTGTIDDLPAVMTDVKWNSLIGRYENSSDYVTIFDEEYASERSYIGGSLERNSTAFMVYAPFGNCYLAKIQAVNEAGESAACYVTLGENFTLVDETDTGYVGGASYEGKSFTTGDSTSKVIHLYKIVYNLAGGTYYDGGGSSEFSSPSWIIKYKTYGDGSILCPTSTKSQATTLSDSAPALIYTAAGFDSGTNEDNTYRENFEKTYRISLGDRWRRWKVNSIGGSDYDSTGDETSDGFTYQKPANYTGYTSLYLFARYDLND